MPAGSITWGGTLVHVPSVPLRAHDWHAPVQAKSQQIPCAQVPLVHSEACEQEAPLLFRPQLESIQTLGGAHSLLCEQLPKHRVPLHTKGKHGRGSGATHWPVMLQLEGGV
jgi:hypothetical protein